MTDQTTTGTITTTTTTSSSSLWRRQVEALMLARGGVVLADSADASRCYPDLWRSPAAARQAFHRARRVTPHPRHCPAANCHAPVRRATYQRAGAGKRPASLIYYPGAVGDLRSWLEGRVGPLVRLFELEATGEAPTPVLAGHGGASAPLGDVDLPEPTPAALAPATAPGAAVAAGSPLPRDRIRLSSLVQRLEDARPRRTWGVRELDRQAWEAAARTAALLPSAAWAAWRTTVGSACR